MKPADLERFDQEIMPHLDGAYALARLLSRNDHDAEDIVQDALIKAMRFLASYQGINARGWLLSIVRNTAYSRLRASGAKDLLMDDDPTEAVDQRGTPPIETLIAEENRELVRSLLDRLPIPMREVLLLREVEELSYKSIAEIIQAPIGTVMSRLGRARERLSTLLSAATKDHAS